MKNITNLLKLSFISKFLLFFSLFALSISCGEGTKEKITVLSKQYNIDLEHILSKSGDNRRELVSAIDNCSDDNIEGLLFLLNNMPDRDLKSLTSKFLLTNVNLSYKVSKEANWGDKVPNDIFLNYVLPYVNLHERRDDWREDFYNNFFPVVKNLNTISEATLKLNEHIWNVIDVHYSTKRPKADQSPYESIEAGQASCTGLSIILIDVCRAVGIPARFVGVPLWKDKSGNHSWVEVWDDGWHFIGAEEKSPLNETWFGERAKTADDSDWKYSIYASSFKKTEVVFPPLFDSTATYVYADIVTDRYGERLVDNDMVNLAIRLFDGKASQRVNGKIEIMNEGVVIESGETKNEKHDYNDFLIFSVEPNKKYQIRAEYENLTQTKDIEIGENKYQFFNFYLEK